MSFAPSLTAQPVDRLLAEFVRSSTEGMAVASLDLQQLHYANEAFRRLFAVTPERLAAEPRAWLDSITPLDGRGLGPKLRELRAGGACVLLHRVGGGGRPDRVVETSFQLSADGQRLQIIAREAAPNTPTPRRDAILAAAVERLVDGFAVTDATGRYTFMNDAHAAIFGYDSGAEFVGQEWSVLYGPEEQRYLRESVFPQLVCMGHWQGEVPGRRKDGSLFPQIVSLTLLPDGGILCSCRDDSDRKRANTLAQQSDALSRALLEQAPMAVVLRDQFGNIVLTNSAGRSLVERVSGTPLAIGGTPLPAALCAPGEQIPLRGDTRTHAARVRTADGEEHYSCFQFLLPADSLGRRFVCLIAIDVTSDKRSAEEAQRTLERQHAYLTMQRQLVASVSHEFRTPLAAIQNATFLLANYGHGQGAEKRAKWLKILHDSTENLRALVEDVLEINQLELTVRAVRPAPLRPAEFVHAMAERFNAGSPQPRVVVESPGPDRPRLIDRWLFGRSLENLVSNALKFSPATGTVRVVLEESADTLTVRVEDRGRGIPPEEVSRLHEPFFRASNSEGVPGAGLGLTISSRAIELHGGRLLCESRLGHGTTFSFTIPAACPPS